MVFVPLNTTAVFFMAAAEYFLFFFSIFFGFSCILCTSTAPQRPAHGTVPAQVAKWSMDGQSLLHAREGSQIQTRDYWFAARSTTMESPLLLFEPPLPPTEPPLLLIVSLTKDSYFGNFFNLWRVLLQFNFISIFTSFEKSLKFHTVWMEAQKSETTSGLSV